MLRPIDIAKRLCKGARREYLTALENGDSLFEQYGVNTPLRLAHFFGQVLHETDGLTIARESGSYRAERIMEIFGVGKHSAAVTWPEARQLAGNGPELFDRVYGIHNASKARELGNTAPGDGWKYRGGGLMQTTGRAAYSKYGRIAGLGNRFVEDPDLVASAEYALIPALAEWKDAGCNALADRNDLAGITKRINGGYNGESSRRAWFNKAYAILGDGATAWKEAEPDDYIKLVQEQLITLGYDLGTAGADGRKGPKTKEAIEAFQRANGIRVDGIAGQVTRDTLKARLENNKAPPPAPKEFTDGKATKDSGVQGAVLTAGGGAAGTIIVAREVKQTVDEARAANDGTWIGLAFFIVLIAAGFVLLWSRYREAGKLPKWLGGKPA